VASRVETARRHGGTNGLRGIGSLLCYDMQFELNHLNQPVGLSVGAWQPPAAPSRVMLDGRFCRLETLDAVKHGGSLFEANSLDAEGYNWTYLPYEMFASLAEFSSWIERDCGGNDPFFFAIVDLVKDRAVGVASYLRITPASGCIEVGHLNFSPLLQRTAAATEAMFLMMKHAFSLGYRRYEWKCNALNAPSRIAAQRLGFSFEGIFRQATVSKGRNRDTAWYAIIDKDWPALEAAFQQWLDEANFDEHGVQKVSLSSLTEPLLKSRG
jgi:RimJ/RimL family protein N-acetyltransferase